VRGPPKARAPLMYVSSLILGYLKLCSRGAFAGREATNSCGRGSRVDDDDDGAGRGHVSRSEQQP
jgi:hypothetical protein